MQLDFVGNLSEEERKSFRQGAKNFVLNSKDTLSQTKKIINFINLTITEKKSYSIYKARLE